MRYDTLAVASVIVFPVIGLEQCLHTTQAALLTLPVYELLHWLSDALLALPLGFAAVWAGDRVADHFGIRLESGADAFAGACIIAMLFALLLVPGAALHDAADGITHSHAVLGVHPHISPAPTTTGPVVVLGDVLHSLTDGLEGQIVGLPLAFVALVWAARSHRRLARQKRGASRRENRG